jgi:hypothetical protein
LTLRLALVVAGADVVATPAALGLEPRPVNTSRATTRNSTRMATPQAISGAVALRRRGAARSSEPAAMGTRYEPPMCVGWEFTQRRPQLAVSIGRATQGAPGDEDADEFGHGRSGEPTVR